MSTEPTRRRRDGFTLPEVLIVVTIMGMISAVLATAVIVTLRQVDSTTGRVNVARAEQSIDTWLPADLSSVDPSNVTLPAVDTDPNATPCGGSCPADLDLSGRNMLQLAWTTLEPGPTTVTTRVQYQYRQNGTEWILERIECSSDGSSCAVITVLHDLGPDWTMDVADPLDDAPGLDDRGTRLQITIDGGGEAGGRGGGINTISLTAGGIVTSTIEPDDFTVPNFVRASSKCGGPVTLIVDNSASIGSAISDVRAGAEAFVEAFRGTPTRVQVIVFDFKGEPLGAGGDWHHYYDMSDDQQADDLLQLVKTTSRLSGTKTATNWEDAWFRAVRDADGTLADDMPNRVVFFTDGVPNRSRREGTSYKSDTLNADGTLLPYYSRSGKTAWPAAPTGSVFHQESFDRADAILDSVRGQVDIVAVGVGTQFDSTSQWLYNSPYTNGPIHGRWITNEEILSRFVTNDMNGGTQAVRAVPIMSGSDIVGYSNADSAELYRLDDYEAFSTAMRSAALQDCGGTVTLQTRLADGTAVPDEFVYENTEYRVAATGDVIDDEVRRVTTSSVFRTGTFDFEIPSTVSAYEVDIVPQSLDTLSGFTPVGWSCKAGTTFTTTEIDPAGWERLTVNVEPNQAVSCVLTVSKVTP